MIKDLVPKENKLLCEWIFVKHCQAREITNLFVAFIVVKIFVNDLEQ